MKTNKSIIGLLVLLMMSACSSPGNKNQDQERSRRMIKLPKVLQKEYTKAHYTKKEYKIEMRDGVKLYTVVYSPKDTSVSYPILMKRTPYSCRPYEKGAYPRMLSRNPYLVKDGYIFVCQDVRGRWMSGGDYTNMTPNEKDPDKVDESSDTYDTIKWLVKNVPNNNGKVGMYGISYPGFYSAAALPDAPPELVAVSPQAPIADFFVGDDFHRRGAFTMSYWPVVSWFGFQSKPTTKSWYPRPRKPSRDNYWFYLNKVEPLKNSKKYFNKGNYFWKNIINHPNYDAFWQKRNLLPALEGISTNVLIVGGWFDAQDLYGALKIYQKINKDNPKSNTRLIMGPWRHGAWSGFAKHQIVGSVYFGENLDHFYKKNLEAPFFKHYLKGDTTLDLPEAMMFNTGSKTWSRFDQWPPKTAVTKKLYLHDNGVLSFDKPTSGEKDYSQYVSDPANPVPATQKIRFGFIPPFQAADQRFAARRPDVLTFTTDVLKNDVTIAGSMLSDLWVSTSGTDSDYIVKVIDIFPQDYKKNKNNPTKVEMGNYHMMVRPGVMRGRFRNSYSDPEPFVPGKVTKVEIPLLDIFHTFKKGHKIQIQIQSTWFPRIDINPQTFVPNIYKADPSDFKKATERIYHTPKYPTAIEVKVVPQD